MERGKEQRPAIDGRKSDEVVFCWKELLDRAFSGWEPADQVLERIIDRMERGA